MSKPKLTTEQRSDLLLNLAICMLVAGLFMTNFSVGLQNYYTWITPEKTSYFSKILIVIAIAFCLPIIIKRFQAKMFWIAIGMLLVYFFQKLLFPTQQFVFKNNFQTFLFTVFPAVICFLAVRDFKSLLSWLLRLSIGISVICLLSMIIYGAELFTGQYVMGFSNSLILPSEILLVHFASRETSASKKLIYLILTASNCLCICIYGSRGALAAILFFLIYIILKAETSVSVKFLVCSALIVFGMLFLMFFETLMMDLNDWLLSLGFNSRTLNIIISDIGHDSGRYEMWAYLSAELQENIFAVRGINADYLKIGVYAHNFVLELLFDLGPVIASIILVYIVYCLVATVTAPITEYSKILTICLFSFIPVALWSGSIWTSMYFWIWIFMFRADGLKKKPGPESAALSTNSQVLQKETVSSGLNNKQAEP